MPLWVVHEVMSLLSHLHPLVVAALLAWSSVSEAQPVARVHREQQLVLSEHSSGTELKLRVARGVTTVVRLDEDVKLVAVEREGLGDRVWVDVAAQSLLIELLRSLAPGETLPLQLLLQQGETRTRLVLLLISDPSEVDTQVSLELRPRSVRQSLEPEAPCPEPGQGALLPEEIDLTGVFVSQFPGQAVGNGVHVLEAWHYRAAQARLIVLRVQNPGGARAWGVSEVVLLSPTGVVLPGGSGWVVSMKAPIVSGRDELVVLKATAGELDVPARLEVREKGGSRTIRVQEGR